MTNRDEVRLFFIFYELAAMQQQVQKAMAKKRVLENQQEIITENRVSDKTAKNIENCKWKSLGDQQLYDSNFNIHDIDYCSLSWSYDPNETMVTGN